LQQSNQDQVHAKSKFTKLDTKPSDTAAKVTETYEYWCIQVREDLIRLKMKWNNGDKSSKQWIPALGFLSQHRSAET